LMHFNLPGTEWTTDQLDVLGNTVVQATQARRDGIPLPMWQARKNCKFPDGVLDAYYQKLTNRVDTS